MTTQNTLDENLKSYSIVHLTLTGYHAGQLLCEADKAGETARGATFMHAVYAPKGIFDHAKLCPDCAKVWHEAGAEMENAQ